MSEAGSQPAYLFEDRQTPGDWHVQWTADDGGFEMAIFSGPRARERAIVFAERCYGATNKSALTRVNRRDMAARGLYKATDGSWRQADAKKGVRLLYKLKEGERWTLMDRDRAMVVHPTQPPKIVYPDGRVEEIASNADA